MTKVTIGGNSLHGPKMYEISIDDFREVTQEDWDQRDRWVQAVVGILTAEQRSILRAKMEPDKMRKALEQQEALLQPLPKSPGAALYEEYMEHREQQINAHIAQALLSTHNGNPSLLEELDAIGKKWNEEPEVESELEESELPPGFSFFNGTEWKFEGEPTPFVSMEGPKAAPLKSLDACVSWSPKVGLEFPR